MGYPPLSSAAYRKCGWGGVGGWKPINFLNIGGKRVYDVLNFQKFRVGKS